MGFDIKRQQEIFNKTDSYCHICRKKLKFEQYGRIGNVGAWEVEHSKPQSKGGTDHLNNLYASCISCNRSKGASSTRSARRKNGYKSAPLSKSLRTTRTVIGGVSGAVAVRIVLAPLGPVGWILGAGIGALIGANSDPE